MNLRPITIDDFPKLDKFWRENYKVDERDDLEHLKIFFDKNPGLSTLAEEDGEIIGTCLGSFDGRKGYIEKVVIKTDMQRKGLGKRIVKETIDKLKEAGALDIRVACGPKNVPFYENCGFELYEIPHLRIKI